MRVLADATNLPREAKLETLSATVRKLGGDGVATVEFAALRDGKQEVIFDLPPLEGQYEIALKATGEGVPAEEVVKSFERTVYGGSTTTSARAQGIPALHADPGAGKAREHGVARARDDRRRLWGKVNAGQDILAAPMRW